MKNLRRLWIYEVLGDSVLVCQKHLRRLEQIDEQIVDVSFKKYLDLVLMWIFFSTPTTMPISSTVSIFLIGAYLFQSLPVLHRSILLHLSYYLSEI